MKNYSLAHMNMIHLDM